MVNSIQDLHASGSGTMDGCSLLQVIYWDKQITLCRRNSYSTDFKVLQVRLSVSFRSCEQS